MDLRNGKAGRCLIAGFGFVLLLVGCLGRDRVPNDSTRAEPSGALRHGADTILGMPAADTEEYVSRAQTDAIHAAILDRLGMRVKPGAALDTGCAVGTMTEAERTRYRRDIPRRQIVSCRIRDDRPAIQLAVLADTAAFLTQLNVFTTGQSTAGTPHQVIDLDEMSDDLPRPQIGYDRYIAALDLDADGTRELMVMAWAGATGNVGWVVFRFDTATSKFAHDSALSVYVSIDMIPGRPCIGTHSHDGGENYSFSIVCDQRGTWITMWDEQVQGSDGDKIFVRVRRERRGDSLALVQADTLSAAAMREGQRWKRR